MSKEQGVLDLLIEVQNLMQQAYVAYDKNDIDEFKACGKVALQSLLWAFG